MTDIKTVNSWQYLSDTAEGMRSRAMNGLSTLAHWQEHRPELKAQYMQTLGLGQLPEPCPLNVTEYGGFEGKGYRVRKMAYQMLPHCWISASIYYPSDLKTGSAPAPAILYVCGHSTLAIDRYQMHPMMWARRGYVCLIVETIQQSDNSGEHHGRLRGQGDHWLSLGYSPTGAEVYSGMRALDLLSQDPLVDEQRMGVTGVSGGGSISFHLAVADERIKAVSTLCGVSTEVEAIKYRKLMRNCDCFYPQNLYQIDKSLFAGLIAPRPALFCFAKHDTLFEHEQTRTLVHNARKIYELYDQPERCEWLSCPGPHGDHVPFDQATAKWMDTHVAGEPHPAVPRGEREQDEQTTSVFQGSPPTPDHLHLLPELLSPQGRVPLPMNDSQWPQIQRQALAQLLAHAPGLVAAQKQVAHLVSTGPLGDSQKMLSYEYLGHVDQQAVCLYMNLYSAAPAKLIIGVANEGESSLHAYARVASSISKGQVSFAGFEGRMAGFGPPASLPMQMPPGAFMMPPRQSLMRAMAMLGLSPVLLTVADLLALVKCLRTLPHTKDIEIYLHGVGDAAVAALYTALLEPQIKGVLLEGLVSSHRDAGPIPGVLRAFDIPQAVGLLAPRKVALIDAGHGLWTWPERAYRRLGCEKNLISAGDRRHAIELMLA